MGEPEKNPDWAAKIETPAYVFDLDAVDRAATAWAAAGRETGASILYALKPLVQTDVLGRLASSLDGFAASSLFEVRLAREILGGKPRTVSLTTPAYRADEIRDIGSLCDHVVLNSLGQAARFAHTLSEQGASVGLRVNPQLSVADDPRYDPCRSASKLGVPLSLLGKNRSIAVPEGIEGLHLHTHSDALDFGRLSETVARVADGLGSLLRSGQIRWINLGGGYPLPGGGNRDAFSRVVAHLRSRYELAIFFEPGASLVRDAGYLVATVLDVFDSGDGATIAVLDTSVNHAPEVFEYQFSPHVLGHDAANPFSVTLAGATCLSGDRFGDYRFAAPLAVGDRIVFPMMGAYAQPKAHWFNGIPLPAQYTLENGVPTLRRRFDYEDYRALCGPRSETREAGEKPPC